MENRKRPNQNVLQLSLGSKQNPMQLQLSGQEKGIQISFNPKDKTNKVFCSGHRQTWIPPPAKTSGRARSCCLYKYPSNEIMLRVPEDGKFVFPPGLPLIIESCNPGNFKAAFYPQMVESIPPAITSASLDAFDGYTKRMKDSYDKQYAALKETEKLIKEQETKKKVLIQYVHTLKKNMDDISKSFKEIEKHEVDAREQDSKHRIMSNHSADKYRKRENEQDLIFQPFKSDNSEDIEYIDPNDFGDFIKDPSKDARGKSKSYVEPAEINIPPDVIFCKQVKGDKMLRKKRKINGKKLEIPEDSKLSESAMMKLADNMRKSKLVIDSALEQEDNVSAIQKTYIEEVEALYEDQQKLLKDICKALDKTSISSNEYVSENGSDNTSPKDYQQETDDKFRNVNMQYTDDDMKKFIKEDATKFELNNMSDITNFLRNQSLAKKLASANFQLDKLRKELQFTKIKRDKAPKSESSRVKEINEVEKELSKYIITDTDTFERNSPNLKEIIGSIVHRYNSVRDKEYEKNISTTTITQKVADLQSNSADIKDTTVNYPGEKRLASLADAQYELKKLGNIIQRLIPILPKEDNKGQEPVLICHREEEVSVEPIIKPATDKYITGDDQRTPETEVKRIYSETLTPLPYSEQDNIPHFSKNISQVDDYQKPSKAKFIAKDIHIAEEGPVTDRERIENSRRHMEQQKEMYPQMRVDNRTQLTDENLTQLAHKGSSGFEIGSQTHKFYKKPPSEQNQHLSVQSKNTYESPSQRDDHAATPMNLTQTQAVKERFSEAKKEGRLKSWSSLSNDVPDFENIHESTKISERDPINKEVTASSARRAHIQPKEYDINYQRERISAEMPDISDKQDSRQSFDGQPLSGFITSSYEIEEDSTNRSQNNDINNRKEGSVSEKSDISEKQDSFSFDGQPLSGFITSSYEIEEDSTNRSQNNDINKQKGGSATQKPDISDKQDNRLKETRIPERYAEEEQMIAGPSKRAHYRKEGAAKKKPGVSEGILHPSTKWVFDGSKWMIEQEYDPEITEWHVPAIYDGSTISALQTSEEEAPNHSQNNGINNEMNDNAYKVYNEQDSGNQWYPLNQLDVHRGSFDSEFDSNHMENVQDQKNLDHLESEHATGLPSGLQQLPPQPYNSQINHNIESRRNRNVLKRSESSIRRHEMKSHEPSNLKNRDITNHKSGSIDGIESRSRSQIPTGSQGYSNYIQNNRINKEVNNHAIQRENEVYMEQDSGNKRYPLNELDVYRGSIDNEFDLNHLKNVQNQKHLDQMESERAKELPSGSQQLPPPSYKTQINHNLKFSKNRKDRSDLSSKQWNELKTDMHSTLKNRDTMNHESGSRDGLGSTTRSQILSGSQGHSNNLQENTTHSDITEYDSNLENGLEEGNISELPSRGWYSADISENQINPEATQCSSNESLQMHSTQHNRSKSIPVDYEAQNGAINQNRQAYAGKHTRSQSTPDGYGGPVNQFENQRPNNTTPDSMRSEYRDLPDTIRNRHLMYNIADQRSENTPYDRQWAYPNYTSYPRADTESQFHHPSRASSRQQNNRENDNQRRATAATPERYIRSNTANAPRRNTSDAGHAALQERKIRRLYEDIMRR